MNNLNTAVLVRDFMPTHDGASHGPRSLGWKHGIPNAADGACFDYRINLKLVYDEARGEVVGPFLSENDFNETLLCGALPGVVHRGGHEIVFTHGDLNSRNVS